MTAYDDTVLALPNLVVYYKMTDTAGTTTAADSGPNTLTGTYATAKTNAPEQVSGQGAGTLGNGTSQKLTRAVTGGNPLQITGSFSGAVWYTPTTVPASGNRVIIGRNVWSVRHTAAGRLQATTNGPAGGGSTVTGSTILPAGEAALVGASWDGAELKLWLNGVQEASTPVIGGAFAATTDAMEVLGGAGGFADGAATGAFVVARAIGAGEWRSLFQAGTKITPPDEAGIYDAAAVSLPIVTAGTTPGGCASCSGTLYVGEPRIDDGGTRGLHHPACYSSRCVATPPTTITGSSTAVEIGASAARLLHNVLQHAMRRSTTAKTRYFTPAGFVTTDTAAEPQGNAAPGLAVACATQARLGGAGRDHWTVRAAQVFVDQMLSQQTDTGFLAGTTTGPDHQFRAFNACKARILLAGSVDQATLSRWDKSLIAAGEYLQKYPQGAPESSFYTNGNIELMEAAVYWFLWRITGNALWYSRYDTQLNYAAAPPQSGSSLGFGFFTTTAGVAADGSDSAGYFAEKGSLPVPQPGLDWNYLTVQMGFLTALRLFGNTEPRIVRWLNTMFNLFMTRVNTTTWLYSATGGTRQSFTQNYAFPFIQHLSWSGLRPDIPATYPGLSYAVAASDFRSYGGSSTLFRNFELPAYIVMASPLWPGLP